MIAVKCFLGQEVRIASERGRPRHVADFANVFADPEGAANGNNVLAGRRFIERNAEVVSIYAAEVDLGCDGDCQNRIRHAGNLGNDRVEKRAILDLDATMDELRLESCGQRVGAVRDMLQPLGTMINGIHRRHHGE